MTAADTPHIPVMRDEMVAALSPRDGGVYVDGTFGAGGYSRAILEAAQCTVVAIDRDKSALARGAALQEEYGARLVLVHGRFGEALALVRQAGFDAVDGFVLDVGVSSMQLDEAARGFSFRHDAPLDMRMDVDSGEPDAAQAVNDLPEARLADIIYQYGEERHARRIAKAIVGARAAAPLETTGQLADIVRAAVPGAGREKIDPATRTFQALRIYVNDELGELSRALDGAAALLAEGGRLVVVSFHSLEDTLVKRFLRDYGGGRGQGSRHLPAAADSDPPLFSVPSRKAVFPAEAEIAVNPRARSARLRWAIRTPSPFEHDTTKARSGAGGGGG